MKFKGLLIALAATTAATPAFAQDFSGPRVEARIGWDKAQLEAEFDDGDDAFRIGDADDTVAYGGEIGFDQQLGGGLLGAYATLDFSEAEQCDELFGEDELCLRAKRNLAVGIRGGFVTGPVLVYGKAGYANGRFAATYEDFEDIIDDFSESDSRDGYQVGAGVELPLGSTAYVKAEYVHTNYQNFDVDADTDGNFKRDQVTAGIGLRF